MSRSLLSFVGRASVIALTFVAMSAVVESGRESRNDLLKSLTVADVTAGGGGEPQCKTCDDFIVTIGCPGGGCHTPHHDFGLFGCSSGEDCRKCFGGDAGDHPGCHGSAKPGTCAEHADCTPNFALRTEKVRKAVASGDVEVLQQLLEPGSSYDVSNQSLVLRSTCDVTLIAYVPVPAKLGRKLVKQTNPWKA